MHMAQRQAALRGMLAAGATVNKFSSSVSCRAFTEHTLCQKPNSRKDERRKVMTFGFRQVFLCAL
jgi:hypothetical protein